MFTTKLTYEANDEESQAKGLDAGLEITIVQRRMSDRATKAEQLKIWQSGVESAQAQLAKALASPEGKLQAKPTRRR